MLNSTDAASTQRVAVHDESVELNFAFAIEEAAATSVKRFVIFHDDDSFLDSVEGGAALLQNAPTGGHSVAHAIDVGVDHIGRNSPGATMNHQNRIFGQRSPSRA